MSLLKAHACPQPVRSHVTRHASHVTRHTSHVTRHTSHVTRHTSRVTRHTSHVTRHTSHVTRHPSHITRHTSHVTHVPPRCTTTPKTNARCNGPSSCARAGTAPPLPSPAKYHESCAHVPVADQLNASTATAAPLRAVRSGTRTSLRMGRMERAGLLLLAPARGSLGLRMIITRRICTLMRTGTMRCVRWTRRQRRWAAWRRRGMPVGS